MWLRCFEITTLSCLHWCHRADIGLKRSKDSSELSILMVSSSMAQLRPEMAKRNGRCDTIFSWKCWNYHSFQHGYGSIPINTIFRGKYLGVSENIVYPFLPNGFADHYPKNKWLFVWEYSLFSDKPIYDSGGITTVSNNSSNTSTI